LSAETQYHLTTYQTTFDEAGETLNLILQNEILMTSEPPFTNWQLCHSYTHDFKTRNENGIPL